MVTYVYCGESRKEAESAGDLLGRSADGTASADFGQNGRSNFNLDSDGRSRLLEEEKIEQRDATVLSTP
jgi:hypothetical protein